MLFTLDPDILRRNIFRNRADILNNLDIDDVREIFNERDIFSSSKFDEIEEKYSASENQMSAVLNEINKSGSHAMRTLVDVLYINQLDSLADSLVAEMEDNTHSGTKYNTYQQVRNHAHTKKNEIKYT
jgi:hypothetical protein